jgi:phospholipase C
MTLKEVVSECVQYCRMAVVGATVFQFALGGMFAPSLQAQETKTASPIKHVIIIVGENRTFDHVFATYKPTNGQTVDNLLSRKIINADGTPGPNFSQAAQFQADDFHQDEYQISPEKHAQDVVYPTLPPPLTGGPSDVCKDNGICTLAQAMASENGLFPTYYQYMLTGGTGQPSHVPDQRIQNVLDLPSGPFQLTSKSFPYDSYAASPVHRFYQMWQQEDCNIKYATAKNPSGWVDGHPASSKLNLFEGFVKKVVNDLKANEELWESTAIFVTVDEGGGYYDSGYVQPLDFFGDGTRIPMIVVSPYTSAGHISHTYTDHVSVLKFIERNWNLGTISKRSRDNLPNPKPTKGNAYVPANSPAIGDLFDLFDFGKKLKDND